MLYSVQGKIQYLDTFSIAVIQIMQGNFGHNSLKMYLDTAFCSIPIEYICLS